MSSSIDQEFISVQQIRDDLNGFIEGLAQGKTYSILKRSRLVAIATGGPASADGKPEPGSKEAMQQFLRHAAIARSQVKGVLDPKKSIKELYNETLDEKYGLPRR